MSYKYMLLGTVEREYDETKKEWHYNESEWKYAWEFCGVLTLIGEKLVYDHDGTIDDREVFFTDYGEPLCIVWLDVLEEITREELLGIANFLAGETLYSSIWKMDWLVCGDTYMPVTELMPEPIKEES